MGRRPLLPLNPGRVVVPEVTVRHHFGTAVYVSSQDVTVRHRFRTAVHGRSLRLSESAYRAGDHEGPVPNVCLVVTEQLRDEVPTVGPAGPGGLG